MLHPGRNSRPQPSRLGSGSNPGTPGPPSNYYPSAGPSSTPNYAQLAPSNSRTPYGNPGNPAPRPTYQSYQQATAAPAPQSHLHPPGGSYPAGDYPLQAYPPQRTAFTHAPTTNAFYSTYPSRLRTGVSVMVQPEKLTGGTEERLAFEAGLMNPEQEGGSGTGASTPTPGTPLPSGTSSRLSRVATSSARRSNRNGMVNYAEGNSDDEFDFDDDSESDSDFPAANGPRPRGRPPKYPRADSTPSLTPQQKEAARQARRKAEMEKGWSWLGERAPAERVTSLRKGKTMHVYHHEDELAAEADKPELLVPITVELAVDGYRIRDAFLWNLNEPLHTPESFARIFCDDLGIAIVPYAEQVADMIRGQIEENQNLVEIQVVPDVGHEISEEDVAVFEGGQVLEPEPSKRKGQESDCRIIINLDVQIYMYNLRDRIEWDLTSALPPAVFAKHYCTELGLSGEALPLITHAIHEELLKHKRDALELGVLGQVEDENLKRKRGARKMEGVWRDWWEREEFGPVLTEMDIYEFEKRELEKARSSRRIKRTIPTNKKRR